MIIDIRVDITEAMKIIVILMMKAILQ